VKLLDDACTRLAAAGVGSPRNDAELLLAHVLGIERSGLRTAGSVDDEAASRFADLIRRRADREPLQYLTGEAPFRFALLEVGPGVFIPRPETELLIDAVLPVLRRSATPLAIDLCAGSGALAVAMAGECGPAHVVAVERSPSALTWLRRNAEGTGIEIVAGDVSDPGLLGDRRGRADVVVSNPPYVPSASVVAAEVAHDPAEAVYAGPDGLAVIPAVIATAARLLRAGGVLAMEHDESHAAAVLELLATEDWTDAAGHRDLTGRPRFVTAVRQDGPESGEGE
jgi:release factor glutamine methyltransferase